MCLRVIVLSKYIFWNQFRVCWRWSIWCVILDATYKYFKAMKATVGLHYCNSLSRVRCSQQKPVTNAVLLWKLFEGLSTWKYFKLFGGLSTLEYFNLSYSVNVVHSQAA